MLAKAVVLIVGTVSLVRLLVKEKHAVIIVTPCCSLFFPGYMKKGTVN